MPPTSRPASTRGRSPPRYQRATPGRGRRGTRATLGPRAPGLVSDDDAIAARLGRDHGAVTYGTSPHADYRVVVIEAGRHGTRFSLEHEGRSLGHVALPVPGVYNACNAAAAITAALLLG